MKLSQLFLIQTLCLSVFFFKGNCQEDLQDAMMYGHAESVELTANSTSNFRTCNPETVKKLKDVLRRCECKPRTHLYDIGILSPSAIVFPSLVEVKRCAGSCHSFIKCVATETRPLTVMVQKFDFFLDPFKPTCGSIELQEDVSCQCKCLIQKNDCHKNQVYHPYACKCICPNTEEEKQCINEGKKWNVTDCSCLNHQ